VNVLGVVPARGGSKGIPRKNIKSVAGKPLLAWTIEAAAKSTGLSHFVVSTEDDEIAKIADVHGAPVLRRPPELATDDADTLVVLQHALEHFPADIVVVLHPTSPIRREGLIDRCIRHFLQTRADSLGTVHKDFSYEYGQDLPRRQEMAPRLVDNGNVYVILAELIKEGRMLGKRLATLEISREEGVEIDEEFDCWLAEQILLYRR
jgi:N-acylneuraminate cytidylyltransferase